MDRVVHLRPGWGFGLSMSSSRMYNYEYMNGENSKGWFQGDGATWMYNSDLVQYTVFWPTADPYRLPGTTVDLNPRPDGYGTSRRTSKAWVGGANLNGFGASGMEMDPYGSTLRGFKSWFMFDDEVVCLGAGISCNETSAVQTTVENRKLSASNTNVLVVNGLIMPATLGWNTNRAATTWCSLGGAGGYFFPGGATVRMQRHARTGSWSQINVGGSTSSITSNYMALLLEHGTRPTNASYAYALLPNFSSNQVASYAAAPHFMVLQNSTNIQAVKEVGLNMLAANFWNDGVRSVDIVTCDRKASVLVSQNAQELAVACSDPTQLNSGAIKLVIARSARSILHLDPGITVSRISPTIELSVNVSGAAGRSFVARFGITNLPPEIGPLAHRTIPEDTSTGNMPFTVRDDLTPADELVLSVSSSDPNLLPPSSFALSGAGENRSLTILPATNRFGVATVWVRASDGILASSNSFQLTVTPVNDPPVLARINDAVLNPGATLALTASASDPELPQQTLLWTLLSAPQGAAISPWTGAFSWRPTVGQAGTSNHIQVRVADNGYPVMSATQAFSVVVNPLLIPNLDLVQTSPGDLALSFAGQEGPDYRVEASTNLLDWTVIAATNGSSVVIQPESPSAGHLWRFYRVRVGP
jgi:hypothetical protein